MLHACLCYYECMKLCSMSYNVYIMGTSEFAWFETKWIRDQVNSRHSPVIIKLDIQYQQNKITPIPIYLCPINHVWQYFKSWHLYVKSAWNCARTINKCKIVYIVRIWAIFAQIFERVNPSRPQGSRSSNQWISFWEYLCQLDISIMLFTHVWNVK